MFSIEENEALWIGRENLTTQSLIQAVRAAGFESLRIPVSWGKVADPENDWHIRQDWLERIQEVVDWGLEAGMHVILNIHHDNVFFFLEGFETEDGEIINDASMPDHPGNIFVSSIWKQVAEHFIEYDDRLIFAAMNEPRDYGGANEWSGTETVRANVNRLNQAALDAIRAAGGNNSYRIIQVPTVGASVHAMSGFVLPDDPANEVNKIAWSIHAYAPYSWAHEGQGDYEGYHLIMQVLEEVNTYAQRLGIPVIMGEWGSIYTSHGGSGQRIRDESRIQHAEDFSRVARDLGMATLWWDNNNFTGDGEGKHGWGLIPRAHPHTIPANTQAIINGIMRGHDRTEYIAEIAETVSTPPPISESAEEDETDEDDEPSEGIPAWIWILIIGIAVAVPVVVFALKKKK
jgi:endoglucanase